MDNLVDIIKKGGIIIIPTDTVYGIATLDNLVYMKKIYDIKKRDEDKKVIALISSIDKVFEILEYSKLVKFLAYSFFPGKLSIIAKSNKKYYEKLNYEYIGIRMPNNEKALKIISQSGGILMTSSANISGEETPDKFININKEILNNVDGYIIDDENIGKVSSTIIKVDNNDIYLLREGEIKFKDILRYKEENFEK